MRRRGSAGEAEPQLSLFGAQTSQAPTSERVPEGSCEPPGELPPPAVSCFAPPSTAPATPPAIDPPPPSIAPPPPGAEELEDPAVLAQQIIDGLKTAIGLVEGMMLTLGTDPGGEPPPPPDAPWLDQMMYDIKLQTRRTELENAKLEGWLRQMSPEAQEAARASTAPKPPRRSSRGRGRLGAEERDGDGVAHRVLTERQRELVRGLVVDEAERIFGPRDRIDDWPALKIVVETLGGRWQSGGRGRGGSKRQGHWTFPEDVDPRELLRIAVETGRVLDPKSNDLYETPEPLADEVVALAGIEPGMRVLEPNGGRGRIALAVRRMCPSAAVLCVELLEDNAAELRRLGFEVLQRDFLKVRPADLPGGLFDRVVMNPPFSGNADARHIGHALGFLRSGGRLVSIASGGLRTRQMGPAVEIRRTLEAYGATWKDLGHGAFSESGTEISTCIVSATRS